MSTMQTAQQKAEQLPFMPERKLDHLPGDYGMPLFGNTFRFLKDFQGLVNETEQKYGRVARGSVMFQRGVTLLGPEANEFLLKDAEHIFSSRAAWNPLLGKLFTNGLMLRDFANHKIHRRIMQQAFKKSALSSYMSKMNPRISQGIQHWPRDKQFMFFDSIKSLLLDVGAETFYGLEMGAEAEKVNKSFVAAVDASLAVLRLMIPGTTWYRGMKGRQYLEDFTRNLIPQKRQSDGTDFFSELCRAAADDDKDIQLTDEDIMNHMIFLLFAAHDTTTSTLSSIIYALAQNPQWQDILREEYLALDKDELEYDDLNKLEKTGWVFREALRMHPPLPTIPRRAVEDTEFQGYRIPKNSLVSVVPLHTHYMEEYWSNPYKFDPERFSDERAEHKKHFYQWIPFGGGHHKCIGLNFAELQSKIVLFHLLKNFKVSVEPGYKMKALQVPLAIPADGLPIKITAR